VKPLISVVIVNFNSGSALESALAALPEGLAGIEWDGLVVDNASTDGSERAAEQQDRITLVRHLMNVGFAAGMNAGIADTSGPLVLVMNPDCVLQPGTGKALVQELQTHTRYAIIAPRILDPGGTLQENARGDPNMLTGLFGRTTIGARFFPRLRATRRNLLSASLTKMPGTSHAVDWVSGACMLARREALKSVGGFDEGYFLYWEDADLCRRLRNAGWEIRYMPAPTVVHDVGQSSQSARTLANREFHRSAYRYFATHVVPQKWHPARPLGWAILRLRCLYLELLIHSKSLDSYRAPLGPPGGHE
jgi:GT2 family glycosyltransferase